MTRLGSIDEKKVKDRKSFVAGFLTPIHYHSSSIHQRTRAQRAHSLFVNRV
jgi:hypothetical protein